MKIPELSLPAPPRSRSALGRPLDPRYVSNWIVVLGSGAAFLFFLLYGFVAAEPLQTAPISAGFTVFLAWAIGREIDPDHNSTAYAAMIIGFVSALFVAASPLFGFGILIGTRLTAGTVGLRAGGLDLLAIVIFGALLGTGINSLAAVPALAVGILVIDRYSLRSLFTALAAGIAALTVFVVRSPAMLWEGPGTSDFALALIVAASLVLSVPAQPPAALTDIRGRAIRAERVTTARVLVAGSVGLAFLFGGAAGLQAAFAVAGASLVGTVVTSTTARIGLGSRSVEAI